LDPDLDPTWSKSTRSDQIQIYNTGWKTCRAMMICVLALTYCMFMLVVPRVIISSHGDFSLESSFYTWFFISSHCLKKYFKYKNILFHNYFRVPKTPFITSRKLIFSFLVTFQQFQALSRNLLQILVKY
jgi:hypothetical protein